MGYNIKHFGDSLLNLVAGLGTSKDKSTYNQYVFNQLSKAQLSIAYRGDWIARKVVNCPAEDATREWREWQADEADIEKLENEEKRFDLQRKLKRALIKARLFGGAALIMGVDGTGDPEEELIMERVKQGALKYVHVVSRYEIAIGSLITDVMSDLYGEPEYYTVSSVLMPALKVHPTRVVRLMGEELPELQESDGWGDSCLQAVDDAIKNVGLCSGGIATLMWEAKIDVIKIPELMNSLAQDDYKSRLIERFTLANQAKSMVNALLLDKEEEWNRMNQSFTGMPEILQLYLQIASGAADIPATRLLGQAPRGLNSTGKSDTRNYYDMVRSNQKNELTPTLNRLDEVFIRSTLGDYDPAIHYEWRSLWQMDETEKADVDLKQAQTHKIDVENGLILEDALAQGRINQLIESGFYPGFELAIDDAKAIAEEVLNEDDPEVIAQAKISMGVEPAPPAAPIAPGEPSLPGQPPGAPPSPNKPKPPAPTAADYNPDQPREPDGKFGSGGGNSGKESPIDPSTMTKVGGQMGSNPAGVYQDKNGDKFYVKNSQSVDHARNEYIAADLYQLAGAPTMTYRDVVGGKQVATEMAPLDKNNVRQFSPEEKRQAQENFAVHAWTANWDAAGLGGDNQVVSQGQVRTVDVGGALAYRAQGGLKGDKFGSEAREWDSMRDANINPDNAKLFGGMSSQQLRASAQKVANISADTIHKTIEHRGGSKQLAEKMIARRNYIAKRAGVQTHDVAPRLREDGGLFPFDGGPGSGRHKEGGSFKEVSSDEHAHSIFEASFKGKITESDEDGISGYSGNYSGSVNKALRTDDVQSLEDDAKLVITQLDGVFEKASLSTDMVTYRGVKEEVFQKIINSSTFQDKGFVSTTWSKDTSKEFGERNLPDERILEIRLPKGSKALPIQKYAADETEREVLINRGSSFDVKRTKNSAILTLKNK